MDYKYSEDFDFENIGRKVKELRKVNHMTQQQVAEDLNVTSGYISNIENQRTPISLRVLSYYAKKTGMTLDDFVLNTEIEMRNSSEIDRKLYSRVEKLDVDEKMALLDIMAVWGELKKKRE
ncbi:MAG: helix-turn-helix transcriptional regulator [Eubacteriales bacterium]|nr:helix-turn-helix transcriptional regulator [Eubacteriales bacterium]